MTNMSSESPTKEAPDLYGNELKLIREGAEEYAWKIYFMLFYIYVIPVALCVLFFFVGGFGDDWEFLIAFVVQFFLTGTAGIIAHRRMRRFPKLRKSKRLSKLDLNATPRVKSILQKLIVEFKLDDRNITFWRSLDFGRTPSVVEQKGEIHLVIPVGMIAMVANKPDVVKAMLAHELTHVMVGDTHLWTMSEAFARQLLFWAGIPFLISAIIFIIQLILEFGWPWNWPPLGATWVAPMLFFKGCERIMELRRRSEIFADVTGALVAGPAAMIEAIETCVADEKRPQKNMPTSDYFDCDPSNTTATHPQKRFRLDRIRRLLEDKNPFPRDSRNPDLVK